MNKVKDWLENIAAVIAIAFMCVVGFFVACIPLSLFLLPFILPVCLAFIAWHFACKWW